MEFFKKVDRVTSGQNEIQFLHLLATFAPWHSIIARFQFFNWFIAGDTQGGKKSIRHCRTLFFARGGINFSHTEATIERTVVSCFYAVSVNFRSEFLQLFRI